MSSKKKKLTPKQSRRIKVLILTTGLLICCCIAIGILIIKTFPNTKKYYTIENRQKNILKERKKDQENVKTVAWLRVQGTNIDTPIINAPDGADIDDVDKEDFLWNNDVGENHYNQVKIMGHNILNLSANPGIGEKIYTKFEDLMGFTYESFAEENKYIQYTVDGKDYIYKVFAVLYDHSYNLDLYHKGDYTKEEMKNYLEQISKKNIYNFDVDVNENDEIICLVTCTRLYGVFDKRQFMVVGRLLRPNEKITNYEVKTTSNYKEIEKMMRGETNNEEV